MHNKQIHNKISIKTTILNFVQINPEKDEFCCFYTLFSLKEDYFSPKKDGFSSILSKNLHYFIMRQTFIQRSNPTFL
jgi:hypothetical protein